MSVTMWCAAGYLLETPRILHYCPFFVSTPPYDEGHGQ